MPKRLTAAFVNQAKPGRYCDEFGLMLIVKPTGARHWIQRITIDGRRRDIGLGGFPVVTLAEAREQALENRRSVRKGVDILAERRSHRAAQRGVPTFAEASEIVLEVNAPGWKDGGKSLKHWRNSLAAHAMPKIGGLRVDRIEPRDIVAVLQPLWTDKRETGRKLRQRMGKIMDWTVAHGYRTDNPVTAAASILPRGGAKVSHMRAMPWQRLPETLATVRGCASGETTKLALEFLALTATRSGEVRAAEWSEIDIEAGLWTIPGERTKTGRGFRVPLSDIDRSKVLRLASEYRDGSGLIFPSVRGRVLSDNTLSKLFRDNGIPAVPHGFRSSFRDWCSEATDTPLGRSPRRL